MKTFSVRNFDKFQHYKDRSPPWIKLYTALLENYEFGRLPDASKAHLLAIWLLASRSGNVLPYDEGWISKRINATTAVDLSLLLSFNFINIVNDVDTDEQDASDPLAGCLTRDRGETEGEREKESRPIVSRESFSSVVKNFDAWWEIYPRKEARGRALKAYQKAIPKTDHATLLAGAERYRDKAGREPKFTKLPATWLNDESWLDASGDTPGPKKTTAAPSVGSPEWEDKNRRLMGDVAA